MVLNKTVSQIIYLLRATTKPLSIHCEAQHIPQVQKALCNFLARYKRKPILYCMTPTNKPYVEGNFGPVDGDYDKKLEQAYLSLHQKGYLIQLHVHLSKVPNMLPFSHKKDVISAAYRWMRDIGLDPTELVLGWWNNEEGVDKIAEQLGLRLVKRSEYRVVHDYEI